MKENDSKDFDILLDGNLITVTYYNSPEDPEENTKLALLVKSKVDEILDKGGDYSIIMDASRLEESHITDESNHIYREVAYDPRIKKAGVVGLDDKIPKVWKFVAPVARTLSKVNWFSNIEEAKMWCKD